MLQHLIILCSINTILALSCSNNGTLDSVCELVNQTISWDGPTSIEGEGTLILENSNLEINLMCHDAADSNSCLFLIELSDLKLVEGSTIFAPNLHIITGNLSVDSSSKISADGAAPFGYMAGGEQGGGGGHAGRGSNGCSSAQDVAVGGQPIPYNPRPFRQYGGAGLSMLDVDMSNRGGGVVEINVTSIAEINGTISAKGADALNKNVRVGAGAGGGLILVANDVIGGGTISVAGGDAHLDGHSGAGSGGRVFVNSTTWDDGVNIVSSGGATSSGDSTDLTCRGGGAGVRVTILNNVATFRCSGVVNRPAPTLFRYFPRSIDHVELSSCDARISFDINIEQDFSMRAASDLGWIEPDDGTTVEKPLTVKARDIFIGGASTVSAFSVILLGEEEINISAEDTKIVYTEACELSSSNRIRVSGSITPDQVSQSVPHLYLTAGDITTFAQSVLQGYFINLTATTQRISGQVTSQLPPSTCNSELPIVDSDHAISVIGKNVSIDTQGVSLSGICVYVDADFLDIAEGCTVRATGCPAELGPGAGGTSSSLPSGGGGHGGDGGPGISSEYEIGGTGGDSYGNESNANTLGSGGGGSSGGAGGGIIKLSVSSMLNLDGVVTVAGSNGQDSEITVDGADGSERGAGGGAAGSISLNIGGISGVGSILLNGGKGGAPGGGGGGGGRVVLTPKSDEKQLLDTFSFDGVVDYNGGESASSDERGNGEHGTQATFPVCGPGLAGLFCVGCLPGQYKNTSSNEPCDICEPGSYTDEAGQTSCLTCIAGTISQKGAVNCTNCPNGTFSVSGSSECSPCKSGTFSNEGSPECKECEADTYSGPSAGSCTKCDPGFFSGEGAAACRECNPRPVHSEWSGDSGCFYQCNPGLVFPLCETPFRHLVNSLGGTFAAAGILLASILTILCPFFCCWVSHRKTQKAKELADLQYVQRVLGSQEAQIDDGGSYSPLLSIIGTRQDQPFSKRTMSMNSHQLMEALSLKPIDIMFHIYRIYLQGVNSAQFPLRLSHVVPPEIEGVMHPEEYADFARAINALLVWRDSQKTKYALTQVLFWPFAHLLSFNYRNEVVKQLHRFLYSYDNSCIKDYRTRSLGNALKVGFSRCSTGAWVDVLMPTDQASIVSLVVGKPTLPMTFMATGDGSYWNPFHFDAQDPLIKSLTAYFGPKLFIFTACLNCHLRTISARQLCDWDTIKSTLAYLNLMNSAGVGIGREMPLNGINIELGYAPPTHPNTEIGRPALILVERPDMRATASASHSVQHGSESSCSEDFLLPYNIVKFPKSQMTMHGWDYVPPTQQSCSLFGLVGRLLSRFFLKNELRSYKQSYLAMALVVMLLVEFVSTFLILVQFGQVALLGLALFLGIPPLACVASPLLGFAACVSSSVGITRFFAAVNCLSCVNAIVALTCFLANEIGVVEGTYLPVMLLISKLIIARLVNLYVAHLEFVRDMTENRIDYLRKDSV